MKALYLSLLLSTSALADHVVALTILAEARGEGEAGMTSVACVILQRSIERGITMREVCLQKFQFSCWNGKSYQDLAPLLRTPQARHALWLEANPDRLDLDVMKHCNHYHADWIQRPYWAKGEKPLLKIGRHIFYRL